MVEVTRTLTVNQSREAVLDYLRDFGRAEEWDPGTVSCRRLDTGPIAVGARWHNVSKVMGSETELTYELTRLDPDHLQFVGKNDTATSTDDISLATGERPGTTEITYHADITFHGAAKLATPIAKVAFEKLGNDTEENLRRILGPA